jgi:hypothetical protein
MGAVGSEIAVQALWPETLSGDWCGQHAIAADDALPVYAARARPDSKDTSQTLSPASPG